MEETINANLEQQTTAEDYLKVINELKANSVSKADYDKVREENRQLLNNIVNGVSNAAPEEDSPKLRKSEDIRADLFNDGKSLTNYDFINLAVELRESVLAETNGEEDIFTVHRPGETSSDEARASAERTADVFKQCLNDCNGSPAMFNAMLQNRMQDVSKIGRR